MRYVLTIDSDDPIMDTIYLECQQRGLNMHIGRYIVVDNHYHVWRIDAEPSSQLTWLLLKYGSYLISVY